jgi:phosphoribosylanthranilate isomerase
MTRVKICGLSRREDIEIINALEHRPEFIGFVFAESRRRVTPEIAAELRRALAPEIWAVGVFADAPIADISALVYTDMIDMIQLHGSEDDEYIRELRAQIPNIPVICTRMSVLADYLLFDGPNPGSGAVFDWGTIPETDKPFFLAGGLNPENVAEAITRTRPFAVDVSSGVEVDGIKNAQRISAFMESVRQLG